MPDGLTKGLKNATISSWVRYDNDSKDQSLYTLSDSTPTHQPPDQYAMLLTNQSRMAMKTDSSSKEQSVTSTGKAVGKNSWRKVTVVFDGAVMKLYENGKLVGENVNAVSPDALGEGLTAYLGKSFYNDPLFKWQIDNVTVWDAALSSDDVAALATIKAVPSNPIAAYDFEDATAVGKDTTGNGNDLTLNGNASQV